MSGMALKPGLRAVWQPVTYPHSTEQVRPTGWGSASSLDGRQGSHLGKRGAQKMLRNGAPARWGAAGRPGHHSDLSQRNHQD